MDAVVVIELNPVLGAVVADTPVDELPAAVVVLDTVVALLDATLAAVVAVVVKLVLPAEGDPAVVAVVPSFVVATVAPLWWPFSSPHVICLALP